MNTRLMCAHAISMGVSGSVLVFFS